MHAEEPFIKGMVDRDGEVEEEEFKVRGAIMRWPELKPFYSSEGGKLYVPRQDYHTLQVNVSFYEPTSDSGRPPYEGNVTSSHIGLMPDEDAHLVNTHTAFLERFDANVEEFRPWPTTRSEARQWEFLYDDGNSEAFAHGADAFVFRGEDLVKILKWVEEAGY